MGARRPDFDFDFDRPGGRRGFDAFRRLPALDRFSSPFGVNLDELGFGLSGVLGGH